MSAPSSSQQQRNFDFTYGNEHARAIVRTHNARLTERAFEYIAQRTSLERAALRGLRSTFPGLTSDDLVQKWIDRLTGASATNVPDPTGDSGDVIEAKAVDSTPRTTPQQRTASIARSAEHGFHHTGCWASPQKEHQIGAIIITDAASSASTGTTTTTIGSPHTRHCHLRFPTDRAPR